MKASQNSPAKAPRRHTGEGPPCFFVLATSAGSGGAGSGAAAPPPNVGISGEE